MQQNVKSKGRDPLTVWQGILLDGHNRYEICQAHGLGYRAREVELADRNAAKAWIIRNQVHRRNLDPSQLGMLAMELEEVYAAQARERQVEAGRTKLPANLPEASKGEAREQAARDMGVSARTVQAAKTVKTKGTPALQQAVREGRASVSAAAKVADLPAEQQDEAAKGGKKAVAKAATF